MQVGLVCIGLRVRCWCDWMKFGCECGFFFQGQLSWVSRGEFVFGVLFFLFFVFGFVRFGYLFVLSLQITVVDRYLRYWIRSRMVWLREVQSGQRFTQKVFLLFSGWCFQRSWMWGIFRALQMDWTVLVQEFCDGSKIVIIFSVSWLQVVVKGGRKDSIGQCWVLLGSWGLQVWRGRDFVDFINMWEKQYSEFFDGGRLMIFLNFSFQIWKLGL